MDDHKYDDLKPDELKRVIDQALASDPVDVNTLRGVAHLGFINNAYRRKIWPALLGMHDDEINAHFAENISINHKHYDQVNKDLVRSLFQTDVVKEISKRHRLRLRVELARIVHALFSLDGSQLHYVQGFHDVAATILLVCDSDLDEACSQLAREDDIKGFDTPRLPDQTGYGYAGDDEGEDEGGLSGTDPETASPTEVEADLGDPESKTPNSTPSRKPKPGLFDTTTDDNRDIGKIDVLGSHNDALAFGILRKLAHRHLKDTLNPTLERIVRVMDLVFPLLNHADPVLYEFLQNAELGSMFTLSWLLTWFSHNISAFSSVSRIFDFLLAAHPAMGIYFCVGVIVHLKSYVLQLPQEMPSVYQFFQSLPRRLDARPIIIFARALWVAYPPSKLFRSCNQIPEPGSSLSISHPAELRHGNAFDLDSIIKPKLTPPPSNPDMPTPRSKWLQQVQGALAMLRLLRRTQVKTSHKSSNSESNHDASRSGTLVSASNSIETITTTSTTPSGEVLRRIDDTVGLLDEIPPLERNEPSSLHGFSIPVVPRNWKSDQLFTVLREDLEDDDPFARESESHGVSLLVSMYPLPMDRSGYDHRLAKAVWGPTGRPDVSWSRTDNIDWTILRRQHHSAQPMTSMESEIGSDQESSTIRSRREQNRNLQQLAREFKPTSSQIRSSGNEDEPTTSTSLTTPTVRFPPLWDAGWIELKRSHEEAKASRTTQERQVDDNSNPEPLKGDTYFAVASAAIVVAAALGAFWLFNNRQS